MRDYQEILDLVCRNLEPFAAEDTDIGEETELVGELGLSSMQVMELSAAVEDEFEIAVPINALSDIVTVRDLALAVQRITQNES